jgi:hypothetical protein
MCVGHVYLVGFTIGAVQIFAVQVFYTVFITPGATTNAYENHMR